MRDVLLAEHRTLVNGAAVAELSQRSIIEATGADRVTFLHNLSTADVKSLRPGQGTEAFFLNAKGNILAHAVVYAGHDVHVIEAEPGVSTALVGHLDRYILRDNVELFDRTTERRNWLLAGPQAADVLGRTGAAPPPAPLAHIAATIAGCRAVVRRLDLTSESDLVVGCDASAADAVRAALVAVGAVPIGADAVEAARIERGWPAYGRDIASENLPQEVGRDARAISFRKGCYLGQETVARIDALGHVNRRLVGVMFQGDAIPVSGTELTAADGEKMEKIVGRVTSAAWSPRLAAPLALAYVRTARATPGAVVGSSYGTATVVALPVA